VGKIILESHLFNYVTPASTVWNCRPTVSPQGNGAAHDTHIDPRGFPLTSITKKARSFQPFQDKLRRQIFVQNRNSGTLGLGEEATTSRTCIPGARDEPNGVLQGKPLGILSLLLSLWISLSLFTQMYPSNSSNNNNARYYRSSLDAVNATNRISSHQNAPVVEDTLKLLQSSGLQPGYAYPRGTRR
jgi:hypothetical protein